MNYGEVKDEFSALLNRRDATTAQKDSWMRQGLERIQRELRIPAMEKIIEITVDDDYDDFPIPNDYLGMIEMRRVSDVYPGTIDRKDINVVLKERVNVSVPRIFAREGSTFLIAPYPEADTVIRLRYYADYAGLTDDEDENIITLIAPTLAIYAALAYAGENFGDKRTDRWEARYQQIKNELESQGDDDELTGGASVSAPAEWPTDW